MYHGRLSPADFMKGSGDQDQALADSTYSYCPDLSCLSPGAYLYSIPERDEEDDIDRIKKMSGQSSQHQSSESSGVSSMSKKSSSSLRMSESDHATMYGSVPDISSEGLHKSDEPPSSPSKEVRATDDHSQYIIKTPPDLPALQREDIFDTSVIDFQPPMASTQVKDGQFFSDKADEFERKPSDLSSVAFQMTERKDEQPNLRDLTNVTQLDNAETTASYTIEASDVEKYTILGKSVVKTDDMRLDIDKTNKTLGKNSHEKRMKIEDSNIDTVSQTKGFQSEASDVMNEPESTKSNEIIASEELIQSINGQYDKKLEGQDDTTTKIDEKIPSKEIVPDAVGTIAHAVSAHSSIDHSLEDVTKPLSDSDSSDSSVNMQILSSECFRKYSSENFSSQENDFPFNTSPQADTKSSKDCSKHKTSSKVKESDDDIDKHTTEKDVHSEDDTNNLKPLQKLSQESEGCDDATSGSDENEPSQETVPDTVGTIAHAVSAHSSIDHSLEDVTKTLSDSDSSDSSVNMQILSSECFRKYSSDSSSSQENDFPDNFNKENTPQDSHPADEDESRESIEIGQLFSVTYMETKPLSPIASETESNSSQESAKESSVHQNSFEKAMLDKHFLQNTLSKPENESLKSTEDYKRKKIVTKDLQDVRTDDIDLPEDVPFQLRKYIDSSCPEWKNKATKRQVFKFALQKYEEDFGVPYTGPGSSTNIAKKTKPPVFGPRDSIKGIVPSNILRQKQKKKASKELKKYQYMQNEENFTSQKGPQVESGYFRKRALSLPTGKLTQDSGHDVISENKYSLPDVKPMYENQDVSATALSDESSNVIIQGQNQGQELNTHSQLSTDTHGEEGGQLSKRRSTKIISKEGYGEADFTSAADLLEHLRLASDSEDEELLTSTKPKIEKQGKVTSRTNSEENNPSTSFQQKEGKEQAEEAERLSVYDVFSYSAQSQMVQDSSYAEEMDRSTPSALLQKREDREKTEEAGRSPGCGVLSYTTPSQMIQGTRHVEEMDRSTPSALLQKREDREKTEEAGSSPGYGVLSYTTPSQMIQGTRHVEEMDRSTPSALLQKREDREKTEEAGRSPGYGVLSYTTPSQMIQGTRHVEEMDRSTPSALLQKREDREKTEEAGRSPGYGVLSYTTPSQMIQGTRHVEEMDRSTPSALLQKREDREKTKEVGRSPGYGVLSYTTPSQMIQGTRHVEEMDRSTPSALLQKREGREKTEEAGRSPGYGVLSYTTPSQMIQGTRHVEEMDRSTLSALLQKREDREKTEEAGRSPGYGMLSYTTPSQMLHGTKNEEIADEQERSTPSAHLQSTDQKTRGKSPGYGTVPSQHNNIDFEIDQRTSSHDQQIPKHENGDLSEDQGYNTFNGVINESIIENTILSQQNGGISDLRAQSNIGEYFCQLSSILQNIAIQLSGSKSHPEMSGVINFQSKSGEQHKMKTGKEKICHKSMPHDVGHTEESEFSQHKANMNVTDSFELGTGDVSSTGLSSEASLPGKWFFAKPSLLSCSSDKPPSVKHSKMVTFEGSSSVSSQDPKLDKRWSVMGNPSFMCTSDDEGEEMIVCDERKSGPQFLTGEEPCVKVPYNSVIDILELPAVQNSIQQSYIETVWDMYRTNPLAMREAISVLDHAEILIPQTTDEEKSFKKKQSVVISSPRAPEIKMVGQIQTKKRQLPHTGSRSVTPDSRSWIMAKEVMESQNRKLQIENSKLELENKLLKEKHNKAIAKINDLEKQLTEARNDVENLNATMVQQLSENQRKHQTELNSDLQEFQAKILSLSQQNKVLKEEIISLEKELDSAEKISDVMKKTTEKSNTLEAYKMEITTLKDEVCRVKSLLQQSELHLQEGENRNRDLGQQLLKLTEVKNLLQQQLDMGGSSQVSDKQIKSLEKRLRITEERLHQERADRANNLSVVEDKLLTENARLQGVEKELSRQYHREKDKNHNLEQKVKDVREENEKLRLALPFDESTLTLEKGGFDIPYGVHATHRVEALKTPEFKFIMSQIEEQSGLKVGQEQDMICHLWNTREGTYRQLRLWESILQDLNLRDNDITQGLKDLRDLKSQYEAKLRQSEEKMQDAISEKQTYEKTYKEQLSVLVKERHDAFARLKTSEDLLTAVRAENEILKQNMNGVITPAQDHSNQQGQYEALSMELRNLNNQIQQLQRSNQLLEGEVATMKVQLAAKDKALEDAHSEKDLAISQLSNTDVLERKQQKIDKLTSEINYLQTDIKIATEKVNTLSEEKSRLEVKLAKSEQEINSAMANQKETKAGVDADNKMLQSLKEEVEEKDRKSTHLSKELTSMETLLQQCKHELYTTQNHCDHLQAQVESLQRQLDQRGHILDTVSAAENENTAQFKILKDTLDSVSMELKNNQAQNKTMKLELSREKDRSNQLLKEITSMKKSSFDPNWGLQNTQEKLAIKDLTQERDKLKEQLIESTTEIERYTRDTSSLERDIKQLQQEIASEKARVLQVSTEKGELEQHLEEIAEEHDALIQEKTHVEDDLVKLENKFQEILQALEVESKPMNDVDINPSQIASELESMKLIFDAKSKEMETMEDKISRQNMELEFLQRRVELLHSENQSNRDDISRLTDELANKIKESASMRDINQFLVKEKGRLETDLGSLQQEATWEKEQIQRDKAELTQTVYKLESESLQHSQKEQNDLSSANHKIDLMQQEQELLLNNLNSEKQTTENLKADLQEQHSECERLRQQIHTLTMDLESCRVQLTASKDSIENLKQDKGAIYQEYDSMCRRLTEKDQKIIELQDKNDAMLQKVRKEFTEQQNTLQKEKTSAEQDLDKAKNKINLLNEELKQKEVQLSTFGKTLTELDDITKQKLELQMQLERVEKSSDDSKVVLDGHRDEIRSLQETINRMQEIQSKTQVDKSKAEESLQNMKALHASQIQELNQTIKELRNREEGEKYYLKDNLSQTQGRLQSLETTLASAIESREKLQVNNRMLERSLEETKEELQEKTTALKVAEQRADTLQSQLNESRKDRFLTEEKLNVSQSDFSKLEKDMRSEKDKVKQLQDKVQDFEALSYSYESNAKAKSEQNDLLQSEINKLKQIIDSQKLQHGGRLKKSTMEFKQQIDLMEMERSKLSQQNQQLQLDLERSRDQMQLKIKENIKLQEEILVFEEQVREKSQKLKHAEESLRTEEEMQSKLNSKFHSQEEELKRLKNFLSKKAEESGDTDKSMWQEMSKVIQDMNRQMQSHFDTQKSPEKTMDKDQASKTIKKYKRHISDLETDLNTEKALHQITRTSLQALEEDCQRLRKQFHAMKRRDNNTDKKYKNRMEAINAIIARSQTQAQAMLAAGGQFEETLRSLATPLNTPRGGDYGGRISPDSSLASDFSFNSIGPTIIPPYNPSSPRK